MAVEIEVAGSVAHILFNKPDRLNAFTDGMWLQLSDHIDRCAADDAIRAVLISGAGRGFCAGADLSGEGRVIERREGVSGIVQMMEFYNGVVARLYHLPKPVIVAVQGAAVGIAWSLALCADWLLVGEAAKFRPAFMNLGKVPEGGLQFLAGRQVGQFRARDIVYAARFVSGTEAVAMGLATRLVAGDALMEEAAAQAAAAAAMPPLAFRLAKRLFNTQSGDFDRFLREETLAVAVAADTADAKEGMRAFVEKRPARFTGM